MLAEARPCEHTLERQLEVVHGLVAEIEPGRQAADEQPRDPEIRAGVRHGERERVDLDLGKGGDTGARLPVSRRRQHVYPESGRSKTPLRFEPVAGGNRSTMRDENLVSHELRVAARGRSARTPLILLLGVGALIFTIAGLAWLIAYLVNLLG